MWELLSLALLLIGLASADDPTTKQSNLTKEESNLNKRYVVSIPQYNPLLYTNSQALPTQQFIFGNSQALVNYINGLQLRTASFGIPSYYILPRNNFIQTYTPQNVVPSLQGNIVAAIPQAPATPQIVQQQILQKQKISQQVPPQVLQQQVVPQQVLQHQVLPQILKQQAASQQIVPEILRQQVIPQVLKQSVVPQQIVPQVLRQQVVPQQIIPQVLRQQIVPQHIVQQQVVPQQILSQRVVPEQLLRQQEISQQVLRPQIVPQPVLKQQIVPQNIPQPTVPQRVLPQQLLSQQIQNRIPSISPYFQNNIVTPLVQQRITPLPLNVPLQYQYYQPQPSKTQALVGGEPYPYEVPPGQTKIPTEKQAPVYVKVPQAVPQVEQNLLYSPTNAYNPVSYFQGQVNSQPQTYYLQRPNGGEQEVRIGYDHSNLNLDEEFRRGQEVVPSAQPHTVYADPNLFSSENNQAVVRIGYGQPHLDHHFVQGHSDNGPQQIKLSLPQNYGEGESGGYQYGSNRQTRTPAVVDKDQTKLKEAEIKT